MKAWLLRVLAVGAAVLMLSGSGLPAGASTSGEGPAARAAGVAAQAAERAAAQAAEPRAEAKTAVIAVYQDPVRGAWTHTTVHPERDAVSQVAEAFRQAGAEVIVGDFSTERDTAFFWSGLGAGGEDRAADMASGRGGVTLGMLLARRDITMPTWDGSEKIEEAWAAVSEEFARQAGGLVRVILGPYVRPNAIWYTEFANLKRNPQVTRVVSIDSETGEESTIYVRGQQRAA